MAIGFNVDTIKPQGSMLFTLKLSPKNDKGLVQVDKQSNTKLYFNVLAQEPIESKCQK